jgi:putative Holliday junction resolvase
MSIYNQNEPNISHYLAIDFGETKIGLAMAESETQIAFSYATLKNDKNILDNLAKIIQKEQIKKIIIGMPAYNNHKKKSLESDKLSENIKKVFPRIEIEYQNEMFSTKSAQANLIEKGMKNIQKYDDREAARIILQEWLDLKNRN